MLSNSDVNLLTITQIVLRQKVEHIKMTVYEHITHKLKAIEVLNTEANIVIID